MPTSPTLATVPELAKELNISIRTAWRLVHERQIAHVKIGRSVKIPREAIHAFIAELTVPAYKGSLSKRNTK